MNKWKKVPKVDFLKKFETLFFTIFLPCAGFESIECDPESSSDISDCKTFD